MNGGKTSYFVTEIPLKTGGLEQAVLKKRFFAAKQQYNALLGEALKRLDAMRSDQRFAVALEQYKEKETKQAAKKLFKSLVVEYGYREYDLYTYCKQWNQKGSWLSIGARLSQRLATRVFHAVETYRTKKRGKPRFKGYRGIRSIEDNSIDANLRLKGQVLHYLGLQLPLLADLNDPVHTHGLHSPIKYARLMQRCFNGRTQYFVQLICEGTPWRKPQHTTQNNVVGLDIGPQTIAIIAPETAHAHLQVFADELKPLKQKRKCLQRKLSRRLRLNNPKAFETDKWQQKDKHWRRKKGKSIKGKRLKNQSNSLKKASNQLADIARKEAAFRKTQHGKLANNILKQGNQINTEKLSYKAFQKLFGSSVGLRAPGMFIEILKRKAENAGGKMTEISTYATKLSQTCHCGVQRKKKLSERWHRCDCGVVAQRDLYSAYLACFVRDNKLMADQAQEVWSGMDIALRAVIEQLKQSSSRHLPASLGLKLG